MPMKRHLSAGKPDRLSTTIGEGVLALATIKLQIDFIIKRRIYTHGLNPVWSIHLSIGLYKKMQEDNTNPPPYHFDVEKAKNIPADSKAERVWIVWLWRQKNGQKWDKVPFTIQGEPQWTDPERWASFEEVLECFVDNSNQLAGIGRVVTEDLIVIDIDRPWTDAFCQHVMNILPEAYWEKSPSGNLRGLCRGTFPGGSIQKVCVAGISYEMYKGGSNKFATITGDRVIA